ncbi:MAG TPA: 4-alpha-glucanotransferase [Pirellulaceae bacterium]|nr:4-alpha-glucanotransferase [Pirellulaceae bacterium]
MDDLKTSSRPALVDAKQALRVDRLVLQIHDASFPGDPQEDLGRGTPYSQGAERFLAWAAEMGFDAIQFGPRGMTSRGNPSPYDATIFSRNPLDLPLLRMVEQGRLSRATWDSIRRSLPAALDGIVPYRLVFDAHQRALAEIAACAAPADRAAAREFLALHEAWLVPDALYGVLCREHGGESWHDWGRTQAGAFDQQLFSLERSTAEPPADQAQGAAARLSALKRQYRTAIEDYALIQWLLAQEHQALRRRLADLGLALYGDLQVGLSQRDTWAWRKLFLRGYLMGAPPSRTNPLGQPWGYVVLDPAQFGTPEEPGPALAFIRARIARVLAECDGLRIDHPHGWVDPWVYRADLADPFQAVQAGARLFSSPDDPRHPQLARYAIARPEQIDRAQPLHADGHVAGLDDDQVRRYSVLMDEIVAQQGLAGRATHAVACEVLSTLPYPVGRVMDRHALGRFRVTQKINLADRSDVYRIENAREQDWIMLGTHDTPPIWQLARQWCSGEAGKAWGEYLAELGIRSQEPGARSQDPAANLAPGPWLAAEIAEDPGKLVNACFTAMLASQARHVVVFFPDLFGMTARYNEPGVVSDANWSLRVPANFETMYEEQIQRGAALDLRSCLQTAAGLR